MNSSVIALTPLIHAVLPFAELPFRRSHPIFRLGWLRTSTVRVQGVANMVGVNTGKKTALLEVTRFAVVWEFWF